MLRRDVFFEYVMEGKKGIKMPRGNKEDRKCTLEDIYLYRLTLIQEHLSNTHRLYPQTKFSLDMGEYSILDKYL